MNDDDVFEFLEGYWTNNTYLVPEGKSLVKLNLILKINKIITKKEWLLHCSLKDSRPRIVPNAKQLHGRASFPQYLEWFSVRGWKLEDTNTIMSSHDDEYPFDEKYVSKRWCLFKRRFTNSTILKLRRNETQEEE